MKNTKILSLILCFCIVLSSLSIFVSAADIEIDLSDLFGPQTGDSGNGGESGESGNSGSDNTGESTDKGDAGSDNIGENTGKDDGNTSEKNNGSSTGSGKVNTVDKTTGGSSGGSSGKSDNGVKKEEKDEKEEIVYNSSFSDVTEDKWFYSYVTDLSSKGIIEGYPDGTFKPQNGVTRAEFVKLLVVSMGYDLSAVPTFDDVKENKWYYTYVSAAVKNGVVAKEDYGSDFNPDEEITRKEAAKLLATAAGLETGKYKTPFNDTDDDYAISLYAACIMQGETDSDGNRYFKPESNISRAEVSTVFSRLIEYTSDPEKFVKEKNEEYKLPSLKVLITDTQYFNREIYGIGISPMPFSLYRLDRTTNAFDFTNSMLSSYQEAFSHLPEYFTLTDLSISRKQQKDGVDVSLQLQSVSEIFSITELHDMTTAAISEGRKIVEALFSGYEEESETEKLRVIYRYLAQNTAYAGENSENDIDYTAYGVLFNKIGVCQGISGAFNILCRAAGFKVCAVSFDNHAFNCVILEGEPLFFDCTYEITSSVDDNKEKNISPSYKYFAVTYEQAKKIYGNFSLPIAFWSSLE